MADLVGIGTVLSGLSGFFGGGGSVGPYKQAYHTLRGAFDAADKYGIHRLAVAGSPAGYSPVPSNEGEGLLRAGEALRSLGNRKKEEELIDAQIEEARSRTVLNTANARRAVSGPQPGLGGFTTRLQDLLSSHQVRDGSTSRPVRVEPEPDMPLFGTGSVGGTTMNIPNPDAWDLEWDAMLIGALVYGPQWLTAQLRRAGEAARAGATEPPGREAARRAARSRSTSVGSLDYGR